MVAKTPLPVDIKIGGISERDLDLFFLEEIVANTDFRAWIQSRIPNWPAMFNVLQSAHRSVNFIDGEVDLEFIFRDESGKFACLQVENKVSAGFQRDQLARYVRRAADLERQGTFSRVMVALLAPRAYAKSASNLAPLITYEEVEEWLQGQAPDDRNSYKARLVLTAIERHGSGYNPDTDQRATNFWQAYWREAALRAPELEMVEPTGKPQGAGFLWFACSDLPGDLKICHKLWRGYVDLHFPKLGARTALLRAAVTNVLAPEMAIAKASKSAAIRIFVPQINTGLPFADQVEEARAGMDAATRLRSWAIANRDRIDKLGSTIT